MNSNSGYSLTILRVLIGILFLFTGVMKLINPAGPTAMLTGLGFPVPQIFAWILLLSEIIFGILVLVGFKTKYTVWPLVIILIVATVLVAYKGTINNPMGWVNVLFHLIGIAALYVIFVEGPGALAISKE